MGGHLLVGLEVPQRAPTIQIGGADRDPVIGQHHLGVQEAGLELVDHDAAGEQPSIEEAADTAQCRGVGVCSGEQQAHIDPAQRRLAQGAAQALRRPEVGRGDPHAHACFADAAQYRMTQIPGIQAGTGCQPPALAWNLRRTVQLRHFQGLARAAPPGLGEQALPVLEHRPCNLDDAIVPGRHRLPPRVEGIHQADAAREADLPIHQQELAMIAYELARETPPGDRIEEHQGAAAGAQPCALGLAQSAGAEAIEQHEYLDAAQRCARKGFDELVGNATGGREVELGQHIVAAVLNGLEHAREEFRGVADQAKAVALPLRGTM